MIEDRFIQLLNNEPSIISDNRRFFAYLKDFFPSEQLLVKLLYNLNELGIHNEIQAVDTITDQFAGKYVKRLTNEYGVSVENACWSVYIWCYCYGKQVLKKPFELTERYTNATPSVNQPAVESNKNDAKFALKYITDRKINYTEAAISYLKPPEGLKYEKTKGLVEFSLLIKRWYAINASEALDVWYWTLSVFMQYLSADDYRMRGGDITVEVYKGLSSNKTFFIELTKMFTAHDDFIDLLFRRPPAPPYGIDGLFNYLCRIGNIKFALDILVACFDNQHIDSYDKFSVLQSLIEEKAYFKPYGDVEQTILDCVKKLLK